MSRVIFLDVDGVLNGRDTLNKSPNGFTGIADDHLKVLKKISEDFDADIVLSSDWKDCFKDEDCNIDSADEDGKYLVRRLAEFGLKIVAKTDDKSVGDDQSTGRGYGIRKYLKAHPEVENYIILDDIKFNDFTDELFDHFIWQNIPLRRRSYLIAQRIFAGENK